MFALGNDKIVDHLIVNGADAFIADDSGATPCDIAIKNGLIPSYYSSYHIELHVKKFKTRLFFADDNDTIDALNRAGNEKMC